MAKQKTKSPKIEEAGLYWASPVYIRGIGTVKGLVNPDHLAAFKEATKKLPDFDVENYLRKSEAEKKPRKSIS